MNLVLDIVNPLTFQERRALFESKELISSKTKAVYDVEFTKALQTIPWAEWMSQPSPFRCRPQYLEKYREWIASSQINKITGLENFPVAHLINGTTQAFDEAYFYNANRRLRLFRGEYAYHRRVFANHKFIEDEPIRNGDFVIISAPFCSTGEVHPEMNRVLEEALAAEATVMIDAAYFGTCHSLNLNVDHPAITQVVFSLTKGVGLGDIRSGVRFSRTTIPGGPIQQQNDYDHTILSAAKIGLYMMENFSPDHIPQKFFQAQKTACELLNLKPTPCMHLALGDEGWNDYRVDKAYNRIGIRDLIKRVFRKDLHEYIR